MHSVGAEYFHADGQPDTTKLTVTFCNFVTWLKSWEKLQSAIS